MRVVVLSSLLVLCPDDYEECFQKCLSIPCPTECEKKCDEGIDYCEQDQGNEAD